MFGTFNLDKIQIPPGRKADAHYYSNGRFCSAASGSVTITRKIIKK